MGVYPSMHQGRRAVCLGGCLPGGGVCPEGVYLEVRGWLPKGCLPRHPQTQRHTTPLEPEADTHPPGHTGRYAPPDTQADLPPLDDH